MTSDYQKRKVYFRAYYLKNKHNSKKYYLENRKKILQQRKEYHEDHKEEKKSYDATYRKENIDKIKIYLTKNKKRIAARTKLYYTKNKDVINKRKNEYTIKRKHVDVNYRLSCNLRTRLNKVIRGNNKIGSSVCDLGCSIEKFKHHIESKFTGGMSWKNYGQWHLDHIIPLSSFNLSDRNEFLKACHYTNYQPLWAIDNLSKGNRKE